MNHPTPACLPLRRGLCRLLLACLLLLPAAAPAAMKVGINLSSITDSGTDWAFVDVFRHAREWMTKRADGTGAFNTAQNVPTDANGWPTQVPFSADGAQQIPHTIMPAWITGNYTITVTGAGTFRVKTSGTAWVTRTHTGGTSSFTLNNTTPYGSIWLEILSSSGTGGLKNFRVMLPGYAGSSATFHPDFKAKLQHFNTIRMMDWGRTNHNPTTAWSQRTTLNSYTQSRRNGVALEYQVRLANELGKNIWVNIPHAADNSYVNQTATLLRDSVPAGRKIYIEYSNEVWNGQFTQFAWVRDNVAGANQAVKYATRSAQIFDIFYNVFNQNTSRGTPQQRLIRVASWGRSQNSGFGQILSAQAAKIDAIAFNAYFGTVFSPGTTPSPLPSVDQLLSNTYSLWTTRQAEYNQVKNYATQYNKQLLTYEGGQHYVGHQGAENNDALTTLLHEANRSWQMRNFYRNTHLNFMNSIGIALHNNFAYCGAWSKWGSWGNLERQDQVIGTAVGEAGKAWAVRDWVQANP
jgi:hypothetical protein